MALTQHQIGLGLGFAVIILSVVTGLWLGDRSRQTLAAKTGSMPAPSASGTLPSSTDAPPSILLTQRPLSTVAPPNLHGLKTGVQTVNPATPADTPPPSPPASPDAKAKDVPKAREIDALRLRRLMDQGVAAYAKSSSQEAQTKAAALIYLSAIGGYRPARDLVAHNFPLSKAVRTVVPAEDAVRYAVVGFANATPGDEVIRVFRAIVQHYAQTKALREFAQLLLEALRDDRRLHFNHALDKITDVLERVPGGCAALASVLSETLRPIQSDGTCSGLVIDALVEFLTKTRPSTREADLRARAQELLTEMDIKP
jgi:hypothetical protein